LEPDDVTAAVEEVGKVLRADGGDLVLVAVDPKTDRIRIRVALDQVSCMDCILPPDMLEEVITDSLRRRVRGEFELVIDDPRRSTSSPQL
jgi:Fe-S cluster biogenesis protein NfuA